MTTVYYTLFNQLPQSEFLSAVATLPGRMQERLSRYRRWEDAHAYLYGKLLLQEGMLRLGFNYTLDAMKSTPFGKPYFVDSPFTFNISHSDDCVVCIISTDEHENIGIDIERIKPIDIKDFDFVFSTNEQKEIVNYDQFYTYWTRKEAVIKADGRGMQIPLGTIDTTKIPVKLESTHYYLSKLDIRKGYIAHVASLVDLTDVETVQLELESCVETVYF